jgi:hypothetical protein
LQPGSAPLVRQAQEQENEMITAAVIWMIGFFFSIGYCSLDNEINDFQKTLYLFLAWPLALGTELHEQRLADEQEQERENKREKTK